MAPDEEHGPSKSQRKRESAELQALGERLVELPDARLRRLDLPDDLRDAVEAARRITARGGRKRQLQYIGRVMREVDAEPIRAQLAKLDGGDAEERAALHRAEAWRTKLLDHGDDALSELLSLCPHVDRQHLRRLVRDAADERAAGRPPRHQRELFRELRTLFDA